MHKKLHLIALGIFILSGTPALAQTAGTKTAAAEPYYSDPAISPDGSEIAFVKGGDIWTVAASGGEAHLLISDPAYDSRPVYSPDGKYLAFNSTRTGNGDIYTFNLKTSELKRITFDDGNENPSAWSADGKYIYYTTSAHDISGMNDIYRVKAAGGTPMPVSNNRYMSEYFGTPSPNGKTLALAARGVAYAQWWRNGSSHLDQSEIWLLTDGRYQKITEGGAKEVWPMWSADGKSVYYVSDRSGAQNLWVKALNASPKQLTNFSKGRVVWPEMAANGKAIVFERDFKVWKYDIATGKAAELSITCHGAATSAGITHQKYTNQFRGLVISPDGKKAAFIVHGDVFVAATRTGGDAFRVTHGQGLSSQLVWLPNSNSLIYTAAREDVSHLYRYDFITNTETQLTQGTEDDGGPLLSPNGKLLAFVRDSKKVMTLNLETHEEKLLVNALLGRSSGVGTGTMSWSPDGNWLAYGAFGVKNFFNVYVVSVNGGEPKQVSYLADTFGGNVIWSPNGKYILLNTNQRTELAKIARIDLVPQLPRFKEDQFAQLFSEQNTPGNPMSPAMQKPATDVKAAGTDTTERPARRPGGKVPEVKIMTDGIRQRLNLLPLDAGVNSLKLSKDGNTLLLSASYGRQNNLYTYSMNELAAEPASLKPLTVAADGGGKSDAQFTDDGKDVFYLDQGKIASVSMDTKMVKPLAVTAEMDVDFNKEKNEVFEEAWRAQNKGYYDNHFHGADWNAVKATYEPLIAGTSSPDEMRRLLSLMVGELNSSHSGISSPDQPTISEGRLGLYFDRGIYEETGKYKITEVVPLGAADLSGQVHVGDFLVGIDDHTLTVSDDLDELMLNKIGHKVALTISTEKGDQVRQVSVRPLNQATEKGLLYRAWVEQQRAYVNKISNGKLGYVHLFDMSDNALNQLYIDLDADNQGKEGVVVDIRNNNGGFVNGYALDVLTRKPYLTMTDRGLTPAPARTKLGQRTLELPTVLVTNQHSLSDAEDFTEGYRTMNLGKVVGEPTGGWIIFTGENTLIDGTGIRMPSTRITDHEGKDMELHPRPVDVSVSRALGEGNDKDSQLDAAVKTLLEQLSAKK